MSSPDLDTNAIDGPFMSSHDIAVLTSLSQNIQMVIKMAVVQMSLFGAYFVLCAMALHTLRTRPEKSRRTYLLFGALILTFIFVTLQSVFNIALLCSKIQLILIDNPELPFMQRVASYQALDWKLPANYMVTIFLGTADCGLLFVVTDILTGWRAISIWQSTSNRLMPIILYFLLFSSFALDVTYSTLYCLDWDTVDNSSPLSIIAITGSTASIVANLIATGMIAHVARGHRAVERESGIKLSGARILVMLTESGLIYAVTQIIRLGLALSFTPSTPPQGTLVTTISVFEGASNILTAMYAPALILIINHGYSIADTVQLNTVSTEHGVNVGVSQLSLKSIRFASGRDEEDRLAGSFRSHLESGDCNANENRERKV